MNNLYVTMHVKFLRPKPLYVAVHVALYGRAPQTFIQTEVIKNGNPR